MNAWQTQLSSCFRKLRFRIPLVTLPKSSLHHWSTYLDVPTPADAPPADVNQAFELLRGEKLQSSRGAREFVRVTLPKLEERSPFCPMLVDKFDPDFADEFPGESGEPSVTAHFLNGAAVHVKLGGKTREEVEDIVQDLVKLARATQPAPLESISIEDTIQTACTRSRLPNFSRHSRQARLGDDSTQL
eukprot:TRINITY_DN435_c0_g1_i1.p1 TRINITY_DN435_c0_g1~~TRINITY_DN435_c0_g1_i1.p1  ORF type:complete len:188 (+),score=27.99 TRINITY_DN435_c0_g1_i1:58-621(+)